VAGSTNLVPNSTLEASAEYDPDLRSLSQILVGTRYSPSPFRTVMLNYRENLDLTRQVELGWQWPMFGSTLLERDHAAPSPRASSGAGCRGSMYTVGRLNYNLNDRRITTGLLGLEYDAGCWIGRVVVERVSTGLSSATTRLMLQVELVGLSSLGVNPLQVLKDNIPGYQLLRDTRTAPAPLLPYE
jgi:LPS-assembly protein